MGDLQKRMEVQEQIIKKLRDDMKKKDQEFTEVNDEKETLIVENDKLRVSANKTMAREITTLKLQLSQLQEQRNQEMNVDETSEVQILKLQNETLKGQLQASIAARKPSSNDAAMEALRVENKNLQEKIKKSGEKNNRLNIKNVELQKSARDSRVTRSECDSPESKKQKRQGKS